MAEIFCRPTKKMIDALMGELEDPLVFASILQMVREIKNNQSPDVRKDFDKWKILTRRLICSGKSALLSLELEKIIYDISDFENQEDNVKKDIQSQKKYFGDYTKKIYSREVEKIVKKVKITDIATKYGLIIKGNKCKCPFHEEKTPSMTFSDTKGVFNCYGCGEHGNLLTFIKKMEERDDNNKRGKG